MGKKARKKERSAEAFMNTEAAALLAELHEIDKQLHATSNEKKCDSCKYFRNGDCGGIHICNDYEHIYVASKEVIDQWPDGKYMGVNYRSGTTRLSGEQAYSKNREDYSYIYNDYGERVYGYW